MSKTFYIKNSEFFNKINLLKIFSSWKYWFNSKKLKLGHFIAISKDAASSFVVTMHFVQKTFLFFCFKKKIILEIGDIFFWQVNKDLFYIEDFLAWKAHFSISGPSFSTDSPHRKCCSFWRNSPGGKDLIACQITFWKGEHIFCCC